MQSSLIIPLLLLLFCSAASGFGSMGPIAAALGDDGFFCAIDAGGTQEVICWTKNNSSLSAPMSGSSSSAASAFSSSIPPMAALSGGEGFLCGIAANTSQALCWNSFSSDLVPSTYRTVAYCHIAAGKNHVCAIRGAYYSDNDSGTVDCWDIVRHSNNSLRAKESSLFYNQSISNLVLKKVVSGDGFSCGGVKGGIVCWGPNLTSLGMPVMTENFAVLASGRGSLCGILEGSRKVECGGGNADSFLGPPVGIGFVSLSAGPNHFCGIREDNHAVECWGSFNLSLNPKGGSGFMAIASSDFTTCGIREDDLVLDCSFVNASMLPEFNPPLELCSPGLCSPGSCGEGEFAFNASLLNEADLTSLCVRKDLKICSPCGSNCTEGFFLSSQCTANADRVCTPCTLCQNSSCWEVCGLKSTPEKHWDHWHRLAIIIGSCASVFILILMCWCLLPYLIGTRKEEGGKKHFKSCIGKPELETDNIANNLSPSVASCPGMAQVFRLSELKDATNGFKEFNELGRGSYGFVYKAILADGHQVAVKRANAATIIHTSSRDFEMELEILCKIRHCNIVNLLGYCSELGERLLVYEYMPRGTLYDHLHSGLSPLNWNLRLNISMQAAKGLQYLHKEFVPPVVHRDIKTSNILLDSDWGARIADFGLLTSNEKDLNEEMKNDVYNFGIVLLEILSGRKSYDVDYTPPSIVEWAIPLIKLGKAAALIDQYVALPRNVEPLLKLADIAELAVRQNPSERPTMSVIATWLEQIVKEGLIL
ncbi:serine/threonine-protein kinase-like protein CCR1 isoform X1 [Tripterygium wilfordii]|uniref:non-specific serine/threonine protein kinase n=1 Tax=Tripterygium wilfordii TaxID=458696 RepID=A0A7J7CUA2_TRIWF|nr:serine/threonine-protein kinase-like protein CCR1 [Tripterygium wilfordii]KAF5737578.1 serine/threonine-protein kinase-like protein CCR1 isoform X1 [Tripterygium wilfordii]